MNSSIFKGFCFGLTSGIITTLGMMVGLNSGTGSKLVVLGGILSVAIADSFSDALGIHVSEEADFNNSAKHVWTATISTFLSKILFSMTFIIPILLLDLKTAIFVSIIWGLSILAALSYFIAKEQKVKPYEVIGEHLSIAVLVIVATYLVGDWLATNFN